MNLVTRKDGIQIIHKLLDRIVPIQIEFAKAQIDAGADIIGAGDSIISQIGPRNYFKASYTHTQQLFAAIKNRVPILYHPCGDNSVVTKDGFDMPQLLADSGASIVDCDFQVNLQNAKQKIGQKVCLRGNVNTQILGSGEYDITRVITEISTAIADGKPNGRYMYAAGCEIPWEPFDLATRNMGLAHALTETQGKY
jgi:uroporphyrinogen decarboxylase